MASQDSLYQRDAATLLLSPYSPALMGLFLPSITPRVAAASEPAYFEGWTAGTVLSHMEQGFRWIFLVLPMTFTLSFCPSVAASCQPLASAEGRGQGKGPSVCSVQMARQLWQHSLGTGTKKSEVQEWHLCPSAEVLQESLQHKGFLVLLSLSRNFSNPNPGNLSQASRGSSNRARLLDKGATCSTPCMTAEIIARARVSKDKCHFHSSSCVCQNMSQKIPLTSLNFLLSQFWGERVHPLTLTMAHYSMKN